MKNRFQFLTYSGFYLQTGHGYQILIDPFLDENPGTRFRSADFTGIDLVMVTHGAYDHVGDAGEIAGRCGSYVICPDDVKALLLAQGVPERQIMAVPWGMTVDFGPVQVRPIENHHRSVVRLPDGGYAASQPLSYLLTLEDGTRVYVAGDTALFSDMKLQGELYRPHIGLIHAVTETLEKPPVPGKPKITTGEMSPYEAALCTQWMGLSAALPCHYICPDANPQVDEYVAYMKQLDLQYGRHTQVIVLRDGDSFWYTHRDAEAQE